MLELNTEYTYKEICNELGWNIQSGNNRIKQKQIKTLEESYEFYHPENKKTHKPKKSYVFTKQLKEPILVDMRKVSEILITDEEFDYLLDSVLYTSTIREKYCDYKNSETIYNDVYVTNADIYKAFGIDIYRLLDCIEYKEDNRYINKLFKAICVDAVKRYTITRICKKYGYNKNSLPKGVLRYKSKDNKVLVPDDDLLELYNEYEKDILDKYGFKSMQEVIETNSYALIYEKLSNLFEINDDLYGVRKCNVISFEYRKFKFILDSKKKALYQEHFRKVVFDAIEKSIDNRINNITDKNGKRKYKHYYTKDECVLLKDYFYQLLGMINNKDEMCIEYKNSDIAKYMKLFA